MTSAFASTSSRLASTPRNQGTESESTGDPWAFERPKTFGRSASSGRSGFGSCSGRDLPWAQRDMTPRAATPERQQRASSPRRECSPAPQRRQPSGTFASRTERFQSSTPRDSTPGPGSYTSATAGSTDNTKGGTRRRSASFGTSRRFDAPRAEGSDSLGPDVVRSAFAPPNLRNPSSAFSSSAKREIYAKCDSGSTPGPGQHHNEHQTIAQRAKAGRGGSAAFRDTSNRMAGRAAPVDSPDMGA
eukprot:1876796-Prymnesium_polylepis.1